MPNSLKSLLPCRCGATPEIDWSGASEIRGSCFQTVTIDCPDCCRDVTITGYTDLGEESLLMTSNAITAWNTRAPIGWKPSAAAWRQAYNEIAATPLSQIKGDLYQAVKKRSEEIEALSRAPIAEGGGEPCNGFGGGCHGMDCPVCDGTQRIESLSRQGGEAVAVVLENGYTMWLATWLGSPNYRTLPAGTKLYAAPTRASEAGDSKDAGRYRWLRSAIRGDGPESTELMKLVDEDYQPESDAEFDAAIDKAIAAAPAPGGGK